ncbi:hypothetical protein BC830DRAFT_1083578 [Chytriomyces sp. MP71]|nr:hypothetical protein BC830DRAFT_1083578 [Chytriomyces sp. MP71]
MSPRIQAGKCKYPGRYKNLILSGGTSDISFRLTLLSCLTVSASAIAFGQESLKRPRHSVKWIPVDGKPEPAPQNTQIHITCSSNLDKGEQEAVDERLHDTTLGEIQVAADRKSETCSAAENESSEGFVAKRVTSAPVSLSTPPILQDYLLAPFRQTNIFSATARATRKSSHPQDFC